MPRLLPNILITGTPGVGKSSFSRKLAAKTHLQWLDVSNYAELNGFVTGDPDPVYQSRILDEDKLLDALEEKIRDGGFIIDHHSSDMFPIRWFDFAIVLIVGNTVLFDRLAARGYTGKKLEDNVECEIFQTILEDVRESFSNDIIRVFTNATPDEMRENLQTMEASVADWIASASSSTSNSSLGISTLEPTEGAAQSAQTAQVQAVPIQVAQKAVAQLPPNVPADETDNSAHSEAGSSDTGSSEQELQAGVFPVTGTPEPQVPRPPSPGPDSPGIDAMESESSADLSDIVSDDEDVSEVLDTED